MTQYSKAIGAFLGTMVPLIATFLPGIEEKLTPEVISSISVVAATALVYYLPNREK